MTSFGDGQAIIGEFANTLNMVITDQGKLLQVMSREVSKENALRKLCHRMGIELSRVITFGDDHNDLGMCSISGYSVAMGNAIDELKLQASEITASNDDDGVAEVLERI